MTTRLTSAEAAAHLLSYAADDVEVQRPNPSVTILAWTTYGADKHRLKLFLTKMGEGRPDHAQWRLE